MSNAPYQLIVNGLFASWPDGVNLPPYGWIVSGVVAQEATTKLYNSYSAKLSVDGDYLYIDVHTEWGINFWKGKQVTLACFVWCATASRARVQIEDGVSNSLSDYHPGNSDWKRLIVTRTIDASATRVRLILRVDNGSSAAYFDGACGYEGQAAFPYMPRVADTGAITTFRQDTAPTALASGDLWITSTDKTYRATNPGDDAISATEWVVIKEFVTVAPPNIEYFSVAQFEENLVFNWYPIVYDYFSYYELRVGETWNTGKLVDTIFVGTQYKLSYFQFGLQKYWIKAYDTSGNESAAGAMAEITITKRPKLNLIAQFGEYIYAGSPLETWTSENIAIEWDNLFDVTYNRRVFDGKTYHRWDTFAASWDEAGQTVYGWDNPKGEIPPSASVIDYPYEDMIWQFPAYGSAADLGASLSVLFVFYEKMLATPGIFVFLEFRTSDDGVTWSDWKFYQAGFITTRYTQTRGTIRGYRPYAAWGYGRYYDVLQTMDMVDIKYSMQDVAISSSGTNVEFDESFTIVPTIVATAMDNDGNDLIAVIDKSTISNTHAYGVYVKGLDGVAVDGFVNLQLTGY